MKSPKSHSTKLIKLILTGKDDEFISELANCNDINQVDKEGRALVHYVAMENRIGMIDALLSKDPDLSIKDKLGWTALHYAAASHSIGIAERMLRKDPSLVDAPDTHGNTALSRAVFESKGRGEMINLLIKNGAEKDRPNKHGISPAKLAETIANYDVKKFFS